MTDLISREISGQTGERVFDWAPASVDRSKRSVSMTISTNTPVETVIADPRWNGIGECPDIRVAEVLPPDNLDWAESRIERMPLLDNHNREGSVLGGLGTVKEIRQEGNGLVAVAVIKKRFEFLIEEIEEGHSTQLSIGYRILEAELIEREGDIPLLIALRWAIDETSIVHISADRNASIRSAPKPATGKTTLKLRSTATVEQEKRTMDLEALVVDFEEKQAVADAAADAIVEAKDDGATEEIVARAKAIRAKRGKRNDTDVEKTPEELEAERADADAPLTEEEKKEVEEVRAEVRGISGFDSAITRMVKLRAKPAEIRAMVRKELSTIGMGARFSNPDVTPKTHLSAADKEANAEVARSRSRFDKMNRKTR